jgi:hypothetical protein
MPEIEAMKMGIRPRALSQSLIAAFCLAALGTSASPQEDPNGLCVIDVPFSEPVPVAISQVYVAPDTVRDIGNRLAPLVYGSGKLPADSKGRYQTKKIFWPLSEGEPGFGKAYDPGAAFEFDAGKFATDGQGAVVAISGEYQDTTEVRVGNDRPEKIWKTRLFASEAGKKFALLPFFEGQLENPSYVRWDASLGRFIVDTLRWETSRSSGTISPESAHYALSDGQLTAIAMKDEPRAEYVLVLDSEGASLELSGGTLAFRSAHGVQSVIADGLLQSFDFGGWTGLFPIGDPGWYLAAGNDTATAFELDVSSSPAPGHSKSYVPRTPRPVRRNHNLAFWF